MNRTLILILVISTACSQPSQSTDEKKQTHGTYGEGLDISNHIGKDYRIDDVHSYVGFKIRYFGYSPVRGRFDSFRGTLFYEEDNPENLSVTVIIDAASINTGNKRRDGDLTDTDTWFDVPSFPTITFQSRKVSSLEDGKLLVYGDFTMKGVTKEVSITFDSPTKISRDWAKNEQVDFFGRTTINRQDYGVFGGDFWSTIMEDGLTQLSDDVEIELDIHSRRPDYQARYDDADSSDLVVRIVDAMNAQGLDAGLGIIESAHASSELSAGRLSSAGYTLNTWGLHAEALAVFRKRLERYPESAISWDQLGITYLHLDKVDSAKKMFRTALETDSADTRAMEYLRYLD